MKIDTLTNEPAQASAGPEMEDAPTTGDGRMAGGHLGVRDPRVISKGETESNEEDVEEVPLLGVICLEQPEMLLI